MRHFFGDAQLQAAVDRLVKIGLGHAIGHVALARGNRADLFISLHADAGPGVRPCFRKPLMTEMHAYLDGITGNPQAIAALQPM